jgi:hypothetical protein
MSEAAGEGVLMSEEQGLREARRSWSEAAAHLEQNDVQAAHECYRRAVELLDEYGTADERLRAHHEWVGALRGQGQPQLVLEALKVGSTLAPRTERDPN